MRFKTLSPADLKEDVAWKTAMPTAYRVLVGALTWPLRWRYDYGSHSAQRLSALYWMTAASLAPSSTWASTRLAAIGRADAAGFQL